MQQYLLLLIVLTIVSQSEGATIGAYSTSDCTGSFLEYTFFEDICAAQNGRGIASVSCGSSYLKAYIWPDSKKPGLSVPQCGTGTPTFVEASTSCTQQGTSSIYTKIIDTTCFAPSTTYLAYPYLYSCSKALDNGEQYTTINADGQCRKVPGDTYYYKATTVTSTSISFQVYTSSSCAVKDATWTSIPTNGVCYAASNLAILPRYESISVAKPAAYGTSSAAGLVAGVVIIIVIGSLIGCCAGILSIFHCMGCINVPCFNQCCDRRKTVVTSSAPPPVFVQNVVNSNPPQGYSSSGGGQQHSFAQPSYPSQYPSAQSQYSSGHSPYPGGAQNVQSPYPSAQSQYAGGAQQPQPSYAQQPQPSYAQQPQSTYLQQPTSFGQQPTYPQQQPQYGQQQPQYGQQAQRRSSDPYGGMRL